MLLPDPVARATRRWPAGLAVVDGDVRLSWRDLAAQVAGCARLLREAGLEPGDRAAVLAGPSADFVVLVHAARAAGVVLVPLAPRGAAPELAWQVQHAAPRLLLHDDARAALAASVLRRLEGVIQPPALDLDLLTGAEGLSAIPGRRDAPTEVDASTTATILFTSGTTGRPKGAVLTWANHLASALAWASVVDPRPEDRWLLALPVHHVAGIGTILRASVAGSAVVCAGDGFDARVVVELIAREGITHLSVVATTLERLLDALSPTGGPQVGSLRAVLLGGGPWPPDLPLRALAAGLPILTTYGMTEAASGVAALPTDLVAGHPGASGRALAGVDLSVEVEGRPAAPGEVGEIVITGRTIFSGYFGDPAATAAALRDGRLHTGDLGSLDADGILTVADRRDDLFVSGGENVYPAEVEAVLRSHPSVVDAGVVGVPDATWGSVAFAFVVLRPEARVAADPADQAGQATAEAGTGADPVTEAGAGADPATVAGEEALRSFVRDHLAGYKVPARVIAVQAIPRTAAGKILRRELRTMAAATAEASVPREARHPATAAAVRPRNAKPADASARSATAGHPVRHARRLVRDGAAIAYGLTGSGPGVVLLHATLSRGRAWLPVERRLSTRATVVSIDRRGHRVSPDPDPLRLTIADHVADVAAIVEHEGIGPALVVGHSFGGCVALELAARRPDLVAGVVAYEPPYLPLAPARARRAMEQVGVAAVAAHAAGDGPLAAETFLRAVLGDAGFESLPAGVRAAVLQEGDAAASDARLAGLDPVGLARIRVPVTVVVGEAGSAAYRIVADAIAAAVPSARVIAVPGADHMAPVSHPEWIAPIIDAAFDAAFTPEGDGRPGSLSAARPTPSSIIRPGS